MLTAIDANLQEYFAVGVSRRIRALPRASTNLRTFAVAQIACGHRVHAAFAVRAGMLTATIALALVASVKSEIQSGPTVSQDTAPASIERAAHKHVPRDSRRGLFIHSHTPHSHTPHTHLPPPQPPSPPPPPPYAPGTSVVSTTAGLTSALANTIFGHIVLAPGTYYLSAELSVNRSVVLEAAVAGTVVLNAQASSSSPRRVLRINPGSSGVVQLIRLSITGGYTSSVCALRSSKLSIAPMGKCPHGKIANKLASTHTCTTATDAPVNYRVMYVPQRCSLSSPSPPWETHVLLVVCRAVVSMSLPAQ